MDDKGKEEEEINTTWRIPKSLLIISKWDTPAMSVFATELVCGEHRNDMGVIFEREVSSNHFTRSNNELLYDDCFRAVKDSKTAVKER